MPRIFLLPEEVASQVAAGEVIERPASVVKELVENSIDAEARRIEIAIARGGSGLIRVVDDGIGMDRDDALLSLERHATSKIRSGHDLAKIHTLGFRGEALPSIASVSRFRMSTRPREGLEGTEIVVNGGKIESVRAAGDAPGTQIEVRSLFYNLPARRKFLRTENTEASHVEHQLLLQAIGHPNIGFVLIRDKTLLFQAPPAKSLGDRIRDLRGSELLEELLEIEPSPANGIVVSGFISKAGTSRSTRAEQFLFVNGRAIENITIQHGLREGYHTALMKGQYPVTFLFVEMDSESVDVNVHPAKREVRFRDPDTVRNAVSETVRRTLAADRRRWTESFRRPAEAAMPPVMPESPAQTRVVDPQPALIPPVEQFALRRDWAEFHSAPSLAKTAPLNCPDPVEPPVARPAIIAGSKPLFEFKLLGILGKLYILMESPDGLVLVDQHAAHERILFEKLRSQMEMQGVPTQRLLIPLTVAVTPKDYDWIATNAHTLERMGFAMEPFGNSTLKIDGIPPYFTTENPSVAIRQLVDELRSMTLTTSRLRMGEDAIAKTVCRHAIKANDELHSAEVENLLRDLLACELPYCCPHGRPTMIQIGYSELEKKFGRRV
ncbi:MAG TPA: DNA mismatch repair endonuclease MutL [Chthoniobacterales bacterium]|jgi:DNA mismatch repair protein MutL|nr:DNA mismatch repair endonuclease MutL [Chthoniobacterales bacterium]